MALAETATQAGFRVESFSGNIKLQQDKSGLNRHSMSYGVVIDFRTAP